MNEQDRPATQEYYSATIINMFEDFLKGNVRPDDMSNMLSPAMINHLFPQGNIKFTLPEHAQSVEDIRFADPGFKKLWDGLLLATFKHFNKEEEYGSTP